VWLQTLEGTIKLGPLATEFFPCCHEAPADGEQHGIILTLQRPCERRERLDSALTVEQGLMDATAHPVQRPRGQGATRDRREHNQTATEQKAGMQALDHHTCPFRTIVRPP
jgi:hypothetical protein